MQTAPGKAHRKGISIFELTERFPDEASAEKWFEQMRWHGHRHCPHCGNTETKETKSRKPMPYWCGGCRSYFSVRTGTPLQHSRLPLRKWVFGIYLYVTHLKGVSSLKLHRDLKITQKTAWFMLHRLREAWGDSGIDGMMGPGPVEADETYVGGRRKNMSKSKRKELAGTGRGGAGKAAVVGVKDRATKKVRAKVVQHTDTPHVAGFVAEHTKPGSKVYTDEASVYNALKPWFDHQTVTHSKSEYVRGDVHTNGIESFWSMFKRGHIGTYHYMSDKHLQRYVDEFTGRQCVREADTAGQMAGIVAAFVGKRLLYKDLIAE